MKTIGLVAHNDKKAGMVEFAKSHEAKLATLSLYCTGTTGSRIEAGTDLKVIKLKSGPLGGDAQLGAMIAEGKLDALLFFIDPLSSQPHDVDVKALTRLAILYDIPFATNLATAEAVLTSVTF